MSKVCSRCKIDLPLENYYIYKRGKYGRHSVCKPCGAEAQREYRKTLGRQGASVEEIASLLAQQGGVCAICHEPEPFMAMGTQRSLSVDHDHETGRIRGLLCTNCNLLLGHAKDRVLVLEAAVQYLRELGE